VMKLRRLEGIEYYQKEDSGQWLNLGSTLTLSRRGGGVKLWRDIYISVWDESGPNFCVIICKDA
jgi:hypothetical protein